MLSTFNRRVDLWLPTYAMTALFRALAKRQRRKRLTHLMFLVCDHFEPRHGITSEDQPTSRLQAWQNEYTSFQAQCQREFGTSPLHTWFYPPHHGIQHLAGLSEMVFDGLGEVELHYHHQDDTDESLRCDLKKVIADYQRWGFLLESGITPKSAFGFIHGDWALGNSCRGEYCGVNDELTILEELGCWGDFTMPSGNVCQTRKINSIYYAAGEKMRPKSHNWGEDSKVGKAAPNGLFLMQGPLGINWRAPDHPRIENASLTTRNWGRPDRVEKWIDCNVHVQGRPDWLFIKLHAHGAIERDFDALFGKKAIEMHRDLNDRFNDGKSFSLHYVTARQAYNIAKAAEHGKQGSPIEWKDYLIQPQPHSMYSINVPHDLVYCVSGRLKLENIDCSESQKFRTRVGSVTEIVGKFRVIEVDSTSANLRIQTVDSESEVTLLLAPGIQLENIQGGKLLHVSEENGCEKLRISVTSNCQMKYCFRSTTILAGSAQQTAKSA